MPTNIPQPETLQDWLLYLAIGVVLIWAVRAFIFGVGRLLIGMAFLGIGVLAGWQVFLHGKEWLTPVLGDAPSAKTVLYSAWIAGGFTYGALGLFSRNLVARVTGSGKAVGPRKMGGALLSLLPSGFLLWAVASGLRLTGSVDDLAATDATTISQDGTAATLPGFFSRARAAIETSKLGGLFRATDPLASPEDTRLTQFLLIMKDPDAWSQLRNHPQLAKILSHPDIQRLTRDNKVREYIAHGDYQQLLTLPELEAAAADPEIAPLLRAANPDQILPEILYENPPPDARETAPSGFRPRDRTRRRKFGQTR